MFFVLPGRNHSFFASESLFLITNTQVIYEIILTASTSESLKAQRFTHPFPRSMTAINNLRSSKNPRYHSPPPAPSQHGLIFRPSCGGVRGWHSFMFGIDEAVVGKLPHLPPILWRSEVGIRSCSESTKLLWANCLISHPRSFYFFFPIPHSHV